MSNYYAGLAFSLGPLVLIMVFLNAVVDSPIALTDKAYLLLGSLAIITYWVIEYIKRWDNQ